LSSDINKIKQIEDRIYLYRSKLLTFFLTNRPAVISFMITSVIMICLRAASQDTVQVLQRDTLGVVTHTVISDTTGSKTEKYRLEAKVDYQANDSIIFDIQDQKAFLYGNAEITYEKTNLKAAYIEIDFSSSTLYATFLLDSLKKEIGAPVFTEGEQSFTSREMHYNFDTKKGLIKGVMTKQGEGYIHGTTVKRLPDEVVNIKSGSYTTCDLPHPHFEMRFNKAKIIPDNKVVTGPAWMVIEDVPIPLAIPFGLFPIFRGRTSGIIIPTYGESANRGFFLENGGYYWGISDYFDLTLRGDIYTRGSWAVKPTVNYKKRYKYGGSVNFSYAINKFGDLGTPEFRKDRSFAIRWSHYQDPKSMLNSSFSANVNIVSNSYNVYNPVSTQDFLTNTFQSSISYQKTWAGKYHLTTSLNHSQNINNHTVDLTLPSVMFTIDRFYPLRSRNRVGKIKWYENISVSYAMTAQNNISTTDSLLFKPGTFNLFKNGIRHSIPVSSSVRVLKYFNLTNSFNYTGRWYSQKIEKLWVNDTIITGQDTTFGHQVNDTIYGFQAVHEFNFTSSLTTKLYGLIQFKKGPIRGIRHVLTPSVSLTLRPDFGSEKLGYWKYVYTNSAGTDSTHYSVYANSLYGTPPDGRSGNVFFNLANNLEIKVRSRKDTLTGTKKITLIDYFAISTSYDLAKDSLQWAPVSMTGRTTLFKVFDIQFAGTWDLYAINDSTGARINTFQWKKNHKLLRFNNTSWDFSLGWNISSKAKKTPPPPEPTTPGGQAELEQILSEPGEFINWNNPWNLHVSYHLRLLRQYATTTHSVQNSVVQTLSFSGDVNITPKWKIGFMSGYDFENGGLSYTSVSFYRDLHCWEMRFNWIPIGIQKSWNFSINAKAPLLQEMKLQKKKDFRDYL